MYFKGLDQQTELRLPEEAASIMAGQELVVPRWHTCIVSLGTA